MKKNSILLFLIFIPVLLICCSPSKGVKSCELKVKKFSLNGDKIKIVTVNRENCAGINMNFDYDSKKFTFFVNFTPKILKNAPPFGFSKKAPFDNDYTSLGVDRHIRRVTDSPIVLNEDTKIKTFESRGKIEISWSFFVKNAKKLSDITIFNDSKKTVTISRLNKEDCGVIYNSLISKPRYVKRLPRSPEIFPFKKFLSFCSQKWQINDPDELIHEFFGITENDLKTLKDSGRQELVNFLKTLEESDLKTKKHYNASGKRCKILVTPVDAIVHEKLGPSWFVFYVEKINKESFEQKFEGPVIELPKGSYIIRAIGNRYNGRSPLVNCYGGENITLAIPVMPNI